MLNPDSFITGLNPPQAAAVQQTEGPVLILAGAGSGKTRVITRRIAYILTKRLAKPSQILAVTFTNKAASEMRERVAELVGKKAAKDLVISTFHSFCLRVLRKHIEQLGYRKNFTISSESDARILLRRAIDDLGHREAFDPGTFQSTISLLKNTHGSIDTAMRPTDGDKYQQNLDDIFERYQSALRAANSVDFDDLLLLTLRLWRECPEVLTAFQAHFRYVMVDEYQDTNRIQYEMLRRLVGGHRNLCVVGDDDQSIYAWRGADSRNILDFERDFPEAKIITLDQNYRSTETILNAANAVIVNNTHRRAKNLWSQLGKGRPIDWFVVGDEEEEAKEALAWLQHIQSKSEAKFSDFAMLYRSNLQSRPIEVALRQAKIPYSVVGGQDFFERAEIKDIVSYLKVIANPRDEAALLRIINMPRRGIGDTTLHQIHDLCRAEKIPLGQAMTEALKRGMVPKGAAEGIRDFLTLLTGFRKRFQARERGLQEIAADLVDAIQYRDEIRRMSKSKQQEFNREQNIHFVLNALGEYEKNAEKPSLYDFLDQSALASDNNFSKQERRQSGVTLMTVHSAKGLEFPFVFILGMEDGLIPHEKSIRENNLDEERRLFYVALTRGKRHVTLFECLSRQRGGKERMTKTSRFMYEIPEGLLNKQIRAAREMVQESVAPEQPKPKKKRGARKKG